LSYVRIEKPRPHTSVIVMDRPERMNSMAFELVAPLHEAFAEVAADNDTWTVVLTGSGRAFCSGADTRDMTPPPNSAGLTLTRLATRAMAVVSGLVPAMRRMPQPVICAVNGPAIGGGLCLCLGADVRIAADTARMNAAFIKLGLSGCDVGVSYLLPRLVGASLAAELILTGRFIHAERARELGLVSAVVPDEQLEAEAQRLVDELLATAPLGLRLSKECLNASLDMGSLEAVVAMEDRNQVLCAQSRDFREGVRAFLEKRDPTFEDR